ncbi:MAG: phosphatidate cytidylyltransferase [Muribaculaceae bacterium]|nr:phosphatidate cytidylyltransferase [Muribaculaceae bacterium]
MKNLLLRAASGTVYVALIVLSILYGANWAFPTLCGLFVFLGIMEFQRITLNDIYSYPHSIFVDLIIGLLLVTIAAGLFTIDTFVMFMLMGVAAVFVLVRLIMQLYIKRPDTVKHVAYSFFSIFYVALPLACAVLFYFLFGKELLLLVFIMIWLNDTGAFIVGSALGSHHLFKRLSPKKSWEGFIGGLAFCIAAGYVAKPICPTVFGELSEMWLVGLGVLVCLMSTWGDLFESMIKRSVGVKDSGNIIPGHGGILDRIDSLLFVAPSALLLMLCWWMLKSFTIIQGC